MQNIDYLSCYYNSQISGVVCKEVVYDAARRHPLDYHPRVNMIGLVTHKSPGWEQLIILDLFKGHIYSKIIEQI